MIITTENILKEADKRNLDILNSILVDVVKDKEGRTPLHWLALRGEVEVLNHPSVDKVRDRVNRTPLHWLAWTGKFEVLNHPSVDKVRDTLGHGGGTPLHFLVRYSKVTEQMLKEKYPWFKLKTGVEINEDLITEIINTPPSIRFILED